MDCPRGYDWYMTPQAGLECNPAMPGFDAGYCCTQPIEGAGAAAAAAGVCGRSEYPATELRPGRRCYNKGRHICCPKCAMDRKWAQSAGEGCTPAPDGEMGHCCPYPDLVYEEADRERARMKALPEAAKKDLRRLNKHLVNDHFGEPEWRVNECSDTGDCFYDCVARALNSAPGAEPPAVTVALLRWQAARILNPDTVHMLKDDYMTNVPDTDEGAALLAEYSDMPLETLRMFMMSNEHWATRMDVRMVYDNPALDVIPIVINNLYGNKLEVRRGNFGVAEVPVMPYLADGHRYHAQPRAARRFVLLYRKGEHFQLIVRTDALVPEAQRALFGQRSKTPAYRAVWTADEVPPGVLHTFEQQLL